MSLQSYIGAYHGRVAQHPSNPSLQNQQKSASASHKKAIFQPGAFYYHRYIKCSICISAARYTVFGYQTVVIVFILDLGDLSRKVCTSQSRRAFIPCICRRFEFKGAPSPAKIPPALQNHSKPSTLAGRQLLFRNFFLFV